MIRFWSFAERNNKFAYGLGEGIGGQFRLIPERSRHLIWKKSELIDDFARGLGSSLHLHFKDLDGTVQDEILEIAKKSKPFDKELDLENMSEKKV